MWGQCRGRHSGGGACHGDRKGNAVILEQKPDVEDGTEVLVLVKVTEDEEQEIIRRQKAMLEKGFSMGRLLYKERGELHRQRRPERGRG